MFWKIVELICNRELTLWVLVLAQLILFCKTPADDKSLCAMGSSNVWPENEGLSTQSIKWKFETHTVKLEFVYLAHSNRRWDLVIWLRPWDQTTNYAVEACQFSKPSEVQDAVQSYYSQFHNRHEEADNNMLTSLPWPETISKLGEILSVASQLITEETRSSFAVVTCNQLKIDGSLFPHKNYHKKR